MNVGVLQVFPVAGGGQSAYNVTVSLSAQCHEDVWTLLAAAEQGREWAVKGQYDNSIGVCDNVVSPYCLSTVSKCRTKVYLALFL